MLVGQLVKKTADVSRFTIDLTVAQTLFPTLLPDEAGQAEWLGTETIVSIQPATVTLGGGQYSEWPIPTVAPTDPAPLVVTSATITNGATAVQLLLSSGTPGNQYTVAVIVNDTAGRSLTCEITVTVQGVAPVANLGVPITPSALPLQGGTMTGPLYLFEDPLSGTEAATKQYVDNKISQGFAATSITFTTTGTPAAYALSFAGSAGGYYTSVLNLGAPFFSAVLDMRSATSHSGGTTNAIWLPSGLGIAFDTAGAAGAAVGTLMGDGTVITSSVPVQVAQYATASLPALSSKPGTIAWATDAKDMGGNTGTIVFRTASGAWVTAWGAAPSTTVQPVVVAGALTASTGVTVTTGGLTVTAGGLTVSAGGAAVTGNSSVTGNLAVTGNMSATGVLSGALFNHLAGMSLSNDGTNPNTAIDVSAGLCADSTNTVAISLGSFVKFISGSFVAGTSNNGMGQGITATANTWYHVFAVIVNGTPDVYFDTSVTAANKPTGTTAFRRLGSIRLDASVHIKPFVQLGDNFAWDTSVLDVNSVTPTSGTQNTVTLTVPPGVMVVAELRMSASYASGVATTLSVYPTFVGAIPNIPNIVNVSAGNNSDGYTRIMTNTSAQILTKMIYGGSATYNVETMGWLDTRGR